MAYGQNQPWGLMAVKTVTGAAWNGQTNPYFIASGYAFNIFRGDLVYLGADGYIHALAELGNNAATSQSIGVFNGCSYVSPFATNAIDPASPGRPYWPAGTVTQGGKNAVCSIIDDPNVVFNIQSDIGGVPFNAQGDVASVTWSFNKTQPQGNTNTGASSMVLQSNTIGDNNSQATANLRILRFVPVAGNVPSAAGGTIPYNNVEVLIQNHSFASRPVGL